MLVVGLFETSNPGSSVSKSGAVQLSDLTKLYGKTLAVDAINASIPAGSYCCILGPSGCGKTTTLRMIAGHEAVTSGDVHIDGKRSTDLAPSTRATSMMFQSYALFPHLNVIENVGFGMRVNGVAKDVRHRRALELLEIVEMQEFAKRMPQALSGGQQQRVALARALATEPAVLALDEPLSALDPFLRIRVRGELKALQRQLGISFLHVTHSQDEALALADYIMVMSQGKIEQFGTPDEIFHTPSSLYVAQFMGAHNALPVEVIAATNTDTQVKLTTANGGLVSVPAAPDVTVGSMAQMLVPTQACGFSPTTGASINDQSAMTSADHLPQSQRAAISVKVHSVEYSGTSFVLRCQGVNDALVDPLVISLPIEEIGASPPQPGSLGTMTWPLQKSLLRAA